MKKGKLNEAASMISKVSSTVVGNPQVNTGSSVTSSSVTKINSPLLTKVGQKLTIVPSNFSSGLSKPY